MFKRKKKPRKVAKAFLEAEAEASSVVVVVVAVSVLHRSVSQRQISILGISWPAGGLPAPAETTDVASAHPNGITPFSIPSC